MNTSFVTKIGKRGSLIIPAELRKRFALKEGDLVITEASEEGLLLKPAIALPVEIYSLERKAEFMLSNSTSQKDYEQAQKAVIAMDLNPQKIKHDSPYKK